MMNTLSSILVAGVLAATTIAGTLPIEDQDKQQGTYSVPAGQEMKAEGVIVELSGDRMLVKTLDDRSIVVALNGRTEIEEKKRNPFRKAKQYSREDLVLGLTVHVEGYGDDSGQLAAKEVKFTQDDLEVAQTISSRLKPVEDQLGSTQSQLDETRKRVAENEEMSQRLGDEITELNEANAKTRSEARSAQQSADQALEGVEAANERISALDDFEVARSLTIHFDVDSSSLSEEALGKLDEFVRQIGLESGFLVEVAGFASSDGNPEYNRRLSEKRALAVRRHLTESGGLSLRRIISPYGYGENNPVADNSTREGRKQNRRVEVRLLVNRGLQADSQANRQKVAASDRMH